MEFGDMLARIREAYGLDMADLPNGKPARDLPSPHSVRWAHNGPDRWKPATWCTKSTGDCPRDEAVSPRQATRRREGFRTKRTCTPRRASMSIKLSVLKRSIRPRKRSFTRGCVTRRILAALACVSPREASASGAESTGRLGPGDARLLLRRTRDRETRCPSKA